MITAFAIKESLHALVACGRGKEWEKKAAPGLESWN
jgi:hypothetical protein